MSLSVKKKMNADQRVKFFIVGVICSFAAYFLATHATFDGADLVTGVAVLFALGGFAGAIIGWDTV